MLDHTVVSLAMDENDESDQKYYNFTTMCIELSLASWITESHDHASTSSLIIRTPITFKKCIYIQMGERDSGVREA